jgi:selenophosphate synthetase-related protein
VTRKRRIGAFTQHFPAAAGSRVVAAFGEDCAVLQVESMKDDYLLLALDAIVPELLRKAPRFAGYSSVLVNVLDIVAMAGEPIAIVDFLGSVGPEFETEVAAGMREATEHFGVPLVGGHLHPDDPAPSLAVAILGRVPKARCVFSHTARPGDELFVAVDLAGKRMEAYPMAWSPLRDKSKVEVGRRFDAVRQAAVRGYLRASKDASNPGIVGTLGMMLEASGCGGMVEVDRIPRPDSVALEEWVLMYQGCGFVFAAPHGRSSELAAVMEKGGMTCAAVGRVESTKQLDLARGKERATVFDFTRGGVTGIPPASP